MLGPDPLSLQIDPRPICPYLHILAQRCPTYETSKMRSTTEGLQSSVSSCLAQKCGSLIPHWPPSSTAFTAEPSGGLKASCSTSQTWPKENQPRSSQPLAWLQSEECIGMANALMLEHPTHTILDFNPHQAC